jgi:lipopolysaccharide transport system ATP-binding protein
MPQPSLLARLRERLFGASPIPTVMHITHIKAGSTWVDRILRELFGPRVLARFGAERFEGPATGGERRDGGGEISYLEMFRALPDRPGHVYPGLFITREEFLARPEFSDAKRFVVIRDLRDTLVSHYFSMKAAHVEDKHGRVRAARERLQSCSKEDGLLFLFDRDLARLVEIQRSWLGSGEIVLRYEQLIADDVASFDRLFREQLGIGVSPERVGAAVEKCRFEKMFGRKLGEVDKTAHARQGLPGDWRNHFTARVAREFLARTGGLLVAAGYERDEGWLNEMTND